MFRDERGQPLRKQKPRPNEPCWCGSGKKYKKCHRPADQLQPLKVRSGRDAPRDPVRPGLVSPMREVPSSIGRPDYAESGDPAPRRGTYVVKTREDAERMRRAGRAAREVLETVLAAVRPGVTTDELDAVAHEEYLRRGGYPSPLNYHGYPKSICTSVNEVICHGIPDSRPLLDGDIVNCDITIFLDGVHGDCSETALVGDVDAESQRLVEVTKDCMLAGIEAAQVGQRVLEVGRAIEPVAERHHYSIVRAFVGHGIGPSFHMDPQVPHYYHHSFRDQLSEGMTFTVEPMINLGDWHHVLWDDQWTAVTEDLQRSAQFEHTLLMTSRGPEILTLEDGVPQPFLK